MEDIFDETTMNTRFEELLACGAGLQDLAQSLVGLEVP